MKRKTIITICDSCGKQRQEGYFKECTVNFHLNEWRGGSIGGKEDDFDINADLCEKCAHKLKRFLLDEMKLKEK